MKSFEEVIQFHGHSCPGLAFGYRVALAALREVGMEGISEDEELVTVVENNSCAVDAIQVLTGCTFGKGNLIFHDHGKQVYTFLKRPIGDGVRISIVFARPEESPEEKEMWTRYSQGDRSEDVLGVVQSRKARKTKAILGAQEAELLRITRVKAALPPEAEIHQSIPCSICGEKVAEPRARVKGGRIVCIPCFEGG